MTEVSAILYAAILLATGLSSAAYLVFFFRQRPCARTIGRSLLFTSGCLQSVYLLLRYLLVGYTPITSPFETVFFFAWSTTWAFLTFRWRYSVRNFGTLVAFLIFILLMISSFVSKEISVFPPELRSAWLPVHAGLSILSYGFWALTFCGGLMYLLLERELKRKRFGFLFDRLPSLDALDQLNLHGITIGFVFYTIGLLTGLLWAKQIWGTYWGGGAKEVWAMVIWFIYLAQIHQRFTVGWRGRQAAWLAVVSFVAVIFALWVVAYFLGGTHSYAV